MRHAYEPSALTLSLSLPPPFIASLQTFAERIVEYRVESTPDFVFSADIAQAIHELWQDPIIPKVMDCSSQFYLMDSAG
jgi:hypothetical protein